jgi:hypothetical protein
MLLLYKLVFFNLQSMTHRIKCAEIINVISVAKVG